MSILKMVGILCREAQVSSLVAAMEGNLPQALLIWGPPSTGKSLVFSTALSQCGITRVAKISAIEIMCGKRPFFETLLKQVWRDGEVKCENLPVFVRQLRTMCDHRDAKHLDKTVIIIDEAEYLRDNHSEILEVLARLQELIQSNLCVVVFSSIVPSLGFSGICSMRSIPTIHFPQYSEEEIVDIITTYYKPKNADSQLFTQYVNMVINVFYQGCRDLRKLLRLTLSNWESVQKQHTIQRQSLHNVWKNVVPQLKEDFKALNSQFLPMTDNNKRDKSFSTATTSLASPAMTVSQSTNLPSTVSKALAATANTTTTTTVPSTKERTYDDIPTFSRYILIGSYLATHNPPSSDKRFFVKGSTRKTGKKMKLNVGAHLQENVSERTRALRSFDQNRLKSIFAFLVSYCSGGTEAYEGNVDWLMQISSLCQSQFLQSLGEDTSGNIKYRCLADYDFILKIAKSVDFELNNYLYRLL